MVIRWAGELLPCYFQVRTLKLKEVKRRVWWRWEQQTSLVVQGLTPCFQLLLQEDGFDPWQKKKMGSEHRFLILSNPVSWMGCFLSKVWCADAEGRWLYSVGLEQCKCYVFCPLSTAFWQGHPDTRNQLGHHSNVTPERSSFICLVLSPSSMILFHVCVTITWNFLVYLWVSPWECKALACVLLWP